MSMCIRCAFGSLGDENSLTPSAERQHGGSLLRIKTHSLSIVHIRTNSTSTVE